MAKLKNSFIKNSLQLFCYKNVFDDANSVSEYLNTTSSSSSSQNNHISKSNTPTTPTTTTSTNSNSQATKLNSKHKLAELTYTKRKSNLMANLASTKLSSLSDEEDDYEIDGYDSDKPVHYLINNNNTNNQKTTKNTMNNVHISNNNNNNKIRQQNVYVQHSSIPDLLVNNGGQGQELATIKLNANLRPHHYKHDSHPNSASNHHHHNIQKPTLPDIIMITDAEAAALDLMRRKGVNSSHQKSKRSRSHATHSVPTQAAVHPNGNGNNRISSKLSTNQQQQQQTRQRFINGSPHNILNASMLNSNGQVNSNQAPNFILRNSIRNSLASYQQQQQQQQMQQQASNSERISTVIHQQQQQQQNKDVVQRQSYPVITTDNNNNSNTNNKNRNSYTIVPLRTPLKAIHFNNNGINNNNSHNNNNNNGINSNGNNLFFSLQDADPEVFNNSTCLPSTSSNNNQQKTDCATITIISSNGSNNSSENCESEFIGYENNTQQTTTPTNMNIINSVKLRHAQNVERRKHHHQHNNHQQQQHQQLQEQQTQPHPQSQEKSKRSSSVASNGAHSNNNGSTSTKKSVRFADSVGLELENVFNLNSPDEPIKTKPSSPSTQVQIQAPPTQLLVARQPSANDLGNNNNKHRSRKNTLNVHVISMMDRPTESNQTELNYTNSNQQDYTNAKTTTTTTGATTTIPQNQNTIVKTLRLSNLTVRTHINTNGKLESEV